MEVYKPTTLLQRDFYASVFLWMLRNFCKGLFQRTSVNHCFWTSLIQSGRYSNRKNRGVFIDNNQRRFCEISKNISSYRTPPVAASDISEWIYYIYIFTTSCSKQAQYLKFKWTVNSWKYSRSNIPQRSSLCCVAGF